MKVIVINYTDWIGYHLVEALLAEGFIVKGKDTGRGNEILADFFGRNANFHLYEEKNEDKFDFAVCIGDYERLDEINADKICLINSNKRNQTDNIYSIHTGMIFGEWMPMDKEAFYHNGKRVEFTSEAFKNEGIYIADFIKVWIDWLKNPPKTNEVYVQAEKCSKNKTEKLDNFFLVKENMPIEENIKQVKSHFKRYYTLYPLVE